MTDLESRDEQQVAAKLIERLLTDPDFRTKFRRNPAKACRDVGLDELAEEMSLGAGKAMMTLDVRESKSSLAGVMMAAAMEGVAVYEFTKHVAPALEDLGEEIAGVLSHVNLPAVQDISPAPARGGAWRRRAAGGGRPGRLPLGADAGPPTAARAGRARRSRSPPAVAPVEDGAAPVATARPRRPPAPPRRTAAAKRRRPPPRGRRRRKPDAGLPAPGARAAGLPDAPGRSPPTRRTPTRCCPGRTACWTTAADARSTQAGPGGVRCTWRADERAQRSAGDARQVARADRRRHRLRRPLTSTSPPSTASSSAWLARRALAHRRARRPRPTCPRSIGSPFRANLRARVRHRPRARRPHPRRVRAARRGADPAAAVRQGPPPGAAAPAPVAPNAVSARRAAVSPEAAAHGPRPRRRAEIEPRCDGGRGGGDLGAGTGAGARRVAGGGRAAPTADAPAAPCRRRRRADEPSALAPSRATAPTPTGSSPSPPAARAAGARTPRRPSSPLRPAVAEPRAERRRSPPRPPRWRTRSRSAARAATIPATTPPEGADRALDGMRRAEAAGLPPELPVMAALVESNLHEPQLRGRELRELLTDAHHATGTPASTQGLPEGSREADPVVHRHTRGR